tara:strand:+ start:1259 stop:1597 length:339 start_codon:yes stop_codon:yes gene_type:complete
MDKKAKRIEDKKIAEIKVNMAKVHKEEGNGEPQQIKLSPSKSRILNMSYPILIENYALIKHKKSNLSATQRQYVQNRIKYLQDKDIISQTEIDLAMNFIGNLINDTSSGITL